MNVLEQIIALVAAHRCVVCKLEGRLLCEGCENSFLMPAVSWCYRCHAVSRQSSVCKSCKAVVKISHVWIATQYQDAAKQIIYKLKFGRAKAVSTIIAANIADILPNLPGSVIVSHIPTANNRVRLRGYDQARLIAKELSVRRGWQHKTILSRTGKSRQVGAGRKERFKHLQKALQVRKNTDVSGKHILLIDDVTTTGATIEAAAKALKNAGAKTIDVAVFAQPV